MATKLMSYAVLLLAVFLGAVHIVMTPRIPALLMLMANYPARLPVVDSLGTRHVIAFADSGAQLAEGGQGGSGTALKDEQEIKRLERFRNCEDIHMIEPSGVALISCDPGRDWWNTVMGTFNVTPGQVLPRGGIWAWNYAAADPTDPSTVVEVTLEGYPPSDGVTDRPEDPPRFHPLGIAYDQKSETLFVINHHPFGSRIDIFSLSLGSPLSSSRAPTATYLRSIKHPQHLISPNAIAIIDRNTLLVTNDHAFPAVKYGRAVSRAEHIIGHPGGSVVLVNLGEDGGNKDPIFTRLDSVTFSNGIAIVPAPRLEDPYKLVVASTSGPSLLVYDLFPAGRWAPGEKGVRLRGKLQNRTTILLPFAPDNLSVDSNGKVLVTGHAHPPTFDTYITTRVRCNAAGPVPADCHDTANNSPSWIAELDLWATGGPRRRDLWVSQDFPSASSAARDTKLGIGAAVGLYARGVLVWWEGSAKDASQELEPNELHATQLV